MKGGKVRSRSIDGYVGEAIVLLLGSGFAVGDAEASGSRISFGVEEVGGFVRNGCVAGAEESIANSGA